MTTNTKNTRKEVNPIVGAVIVVVALIVIIGGAYAVFVNTSSRVDARDTVFQRPGGQTKAPAAPTAREKPATPSGAITGGGGITAVPGSRTSPFGPRQ